MPFKSGRPRLTRRAKQEGGQALKGVSGVDVLPQSKDYVAGGYFQTLGTFGLANDLVTTSAPISNPDGFIYRVNQAGTTLWWLRVGGSADDTLVGQEQARVLPDCMPVPICEERTRAFSS